MHNARALFWRALAIQSNISCCLRAFLCASFSSSSSAAPTPPFPLPFGRSYFTRASFWCLPNIWSMFIFHFTVCAVFVNFHIVDRHHLLDKTCVCISKIMWNSLVAYRWNFPCSAHICSSSPFFSLSLSCEFLLPSLWLSISISRVFTQLIPYQIKHPWKKKKNRKDKKM